MIKFIQTRKVICQEKKFSANYFKKGFCETHLSYEMFILKMVIYFQVQTKYLNKCILFKSPGLVISRRF